MILAPCYLKNLDIKNSLQDIKMSPEWYARNNIPFGSEDKMIRTGMKLSISFDVFVDDTSIVEMVKFFEGQGEPYKRLVMTLEEEK